MNSILVFGRNFNRVEDALVGVGGGFGGVAGNYCGLFSDFNVAPETLLI